MIHIAIYIPLKVQSYALEMNGKIKGHVNRIV